MQRGDAQRVHQVGRTDYGRSCKIGLRFVARLQVGIARGGGLRVLQWRFPLGLHSHFSFYAEDTECL